MTVFTVHVLRQFLPLAVAITAVCATVYLAVQQDIRLSANDPQIHIAEETAQHLNETPQTNFRSPQRKIDIEKSLDTFTMLYGKNGKVVYTAVQLDSKTPTIPQGVFAAVTKNGEDRFTWQPKSGVRIAAVVVPYVNGFVLVGRNIREVENLENAIFIDVAFGWAASISATFFTVLGLLLLFHKKKYR